jgi:hypothetical protein
MLVAFVTFFQLEFVIFSLMYCWITVYWNFSKMIVQGKIL